MSLNELHSGLVLISNCDIVRLLKDLFVLVPCAYRSCGEVPRPNYDMTVFVFVS